MRAAVARRYGGPDEFAIEEIPVPSPKPKEVLVRVEASSLNALDWHFLTGTPYPLRLVGGLRRPKRIVHGADLAGVVVATGAKVDDLAVGDSVFGESGSGGGLGPFARIRASNVAPIPDGVSFEDAAATPVAGLTAIQALRTHGEVAPGDQVLINGAAGGVGTFAVQVAKALGAHVVAVCSTRNVEMVRSIGADEVIDYTTDDFVALGRRFDVMVDGVGNRTADECLSLLEPTGRYVVISGPKDNPWIDPMRHIAKAAWTFWRKDQTLKQFTAAANREDMTMLGEMLADGRVVPQIQQTIGLEGVADAMAEIGSGHVRSKIVVVPSN